MSWFGFGDDYTYAGLRKKNVDDLLKMKPSVDDIKKIDNLINSPEFKNDTDVQWKNVIQMLSDIKDNSKIYKNCYQKQIQQGQNQMQGQMQNQMQGQQGMQGMQGMQGQQGQPGMQRQLYDNGSLNSYRQGGGKKHKRSKKNKSSKNKKSIKKYKRKSIRKHKRKTNKSRA